MSENSILSRLDGLKHKFEEIGQQLSDPDVIADMKKYVALNKEYRDLEPIVKACDEYRNLVSNIDSARDILTNEKDPDMREMAKEELVELEEKQPKLEEEIKLMLIPADPQRRRGFHLCRRPLPHVQQVYRKEGLAHGGYLLFRRNGRRLQGGGDEGFGR